MIVTTILFKTWQPPGKGRLVLNDDGIMFTKKKIAGTDKRVNQSAERLRGFGERARARHAAKAAATRLKVTHYLMRNPGCTLYDIMHSVGMSESAIKAHIKTLDQSGNLIIGKRNTKYGYEKLYTWKDAA